MELLPRGLIWPAEALSRFHRHYVGQFAERFPAHDRERLEKMKPLAVQISSLKHAPLPLRAQRPNPPAKDITEISRQNKLTLAVRFFDALGGADEFARLEENAKIDVIERAQAKAHLNWALGEGAIAAKFIAEASGERFPARPALWFSAFAPKIWAGERVCLDYGHGPWAGRIVVDAGSLDQFLADIDATATREVEQSKAAPLRTLSPLPGEDKQAFIMRTLEMQEPRRITNAEGRQLAKPWLEYRKLPADETAIKEEMKRMTGLMRTLVGPKPKQTRAKSKAKPVRSESA